MSKYEQKDKHAAASRLSAGCQDGGTGTIRLAERDNIAPLTETVIGPNGDAASAASPSKAASVPLFASQYNEDKKKRILRNLLDHSQFSSVDVSSI